jgi:2-oxo-4-hydroxy-4-carboxy-5-ureidoimidazoline decarboxylase
MIDALTSGNSFPEFAVPYLLREINSLNCEEFVRAIGPAFERSPWIARETWDRHPFESMTHLHASLCRTAKAAHGTRKLALVRTDPDLVGREVFTSESKGEQEAAGLMNLSAGEVELFERYNSEYKQRFGFPFVICARLNRTKAILEAFSRRLQNDTTTELATAFAEIEKIARLRLEDIIA